MTQGIRKGIKQAMYTRADKKPGTVFVHLSGPKVVESIGNKLYTLMERDEIARHIYVGVFYGPQVGRRGMV